MRVVRLQGIEAKQVGDCDIGWVVPGTRAEKPRRRRAANERLFIHPSRTSACQPDRRSRNGSRPQAVVPALVVGLGKWCRIGTADDEVQSGQNRVRDQGGVLDPVCIERIPEDLLQPQAAGVV